MAKIAERSGVSPSTISLALRDKPSVGPDTRQRVLEMAGNLRYIPPKRTSPCAPALTNIGLILKADPDRTPRANRFYSHIVAGIEMACRRRDVNLLYATMAVDDDSYPLELPRVLVEENSVDGLLLVGASLNEALFQVVDRRPTPIVLVDAYAGSDVYDAVLSDNHKGAYQVVTYLIQKGHRHIGLVGSHPDAYPSLKERQNGYLRALEDGGIADYYLAECHITNTKEVMEATVRLLRSSPQITAIFGVNDETALAIMGAAQELERQIPGDLSVVGFDDIDLVSVVTPSLTAMHVDKLGRADWPCRCSSTGSSIPSPAR